VATGIAAGPSQTQTSGKSSLGLLLPTLIGARFLCPWRTSWRLKAMPEKAGPRLNAIGFNLCSHLGSHLFADSLGIRPDSISVTQFLARRAQILCVLHTFLSAQQTFNARAGHTKRNNDPSPEVPSLMAEPSPLQLWLQPLRCRK
jgi:hypothetical protein